MMERVTVSVRSGMVTDVQAPPSIDVIIRDYDVEGADESLLKIDEDGDLYREMIW